ncbi:Ankyrin repeat domain-containing protein 17 [Thelotrema lepadinum]|nr:Ankyrin repeat domain-containing protein 17 [Thelotrema lepadinum]
MQLKSDSRREDLQQAESSALEAEIEALAFQLEEIHCYSEISKGKYAASKPPDSEVAFTILEREIQGHMSFLNDIKLAHSVAHAVDIDGPLIADLVHQDAQGQQDRQLALQLDTDDQPHANAPLADDFGVRTLAQSPQSSMIAGLLFDYTSAISEADEEAEIAGPSMTYSERQQEILDRLSTKLLLDRGAELEPPPNYSGDSALNFACRNGNIDLVRLPLNRGIDPNRARWRHSGPLAEAAKNGDLVIALLLLEAGAKVSVGDSEPTYFSSSRPLVAAAWNGRLDMVALLLKHEEREDVVHEAKFAAREMGFYGIESVIEQHLDRDISPHSPMRIEELLDGEYTVGIMEG